MNVFEDLIVELKEENLLEDVVIDTKQQKKADRDVPEAVKVSQEDAERPESAALDDETTEFDPAFSDAQSDTTAPEIEIIETGEEPKALAEPKPAKPKRTRHGKEFFNKRAVDEVSNLQMVEHILTGVEREYMKVVPKAFDDFNAKKALHNFINVNENSRSEEHKAAEFALMHETEAWSLALIERDCNIAVANIRRYCENSRPALSSQAMLALARFYRNSPYSESVRSKFDFVITRLFSRPINQDKRVCLFGREEIQGHVNTLYNDWSSIPLYDANHDESNIMLTGLSFEDLAAECENATHFDQLIESDFFGRLRLFKESINELFYEPSVIAAAIDSNIRIGNAYVDLIVRERQKMDAASIQVKYGDFNDPSISDAAGRTLDLVELLNTLTDDVINAETVADEIEDGVEVGTETTDEAGVKTDSAVTASPLVGRLVEGLSGINKWIMVLGVVGILISGGLYIWSSYIVEEKVSTAGVSTVELDGMLAEHIMTGKINGDTFYGMLLPSWDNLTKEKRQEFLQKVYQLGAEKGYKQVNLIGKDGKQAAFATTTKQEVFMP